MSTMQAIITDHEEASGLAIREVKVPSPAPSEALVRVYSVSLNPGEVRTLAFQKVGSRIGWDLAGVVERAAADGSGPSVGTRVLGLVNTGAWAELVAVPTAVLVEIPKTVTFAQAATLPVAALTALYALEKGGFLLNRKVLVTGASGGVGHFACQLARLAGATVTACVRRAERAADFKERGVDEVIIGEDLSLARSPSPYQLIIDVLGGPSLATALTLLAPGGLCVNVGASANPEVTLQIRYHAGFTGGFTFYGLFLLAEIRQRTDPARDLKYLTQMVSQGRLRPQITVEACWTEVAEVVERLLKRDIVGKAALHIRQEVETNEE
ncbi:oxidoreductase [Ktedonobacter sp. SOSP1-52]|uniref:zinc-binding dehydrogenase n=1 Tax=Ktedonobacter sp. SOSP1-52 TaxID=2778366 RepID=UPI001916A593|nr:zinc-binding dehydrogenase [Ktedonobacter sp. SOSP1-52]GHO71232.1 oxidoreductase [Ktedonobacter sp. SOSP1-52]